MTLHNTVYFIATSFLFLLIKGVLSNTTLSCYECEETFDQERWDPYTECQAYPTQVPLKPCLNTEMYCLTERITLYGVTTSIIRKCTDECYYGCRAHSFGLTTMKCTSCCQNPGCNVGGAAINHFNFLTRLLLTMTCCLFTLLF